MIYAQLTPKLDGSSSLINTLIQDTLSTHDRDLQDISVFEMMLRLRLRLEQKLTEEYGYVGELAEGRFYPEGWDARMRSFFQAMSLTQYMTPTFEQDIRAGRLIESSLPDVKSTSLTNDHASSPGLFASRIIIKDISKGADSFYRALAAATGMDHMVIKRAVKNTLSFTDANDFPIHLRSKITSEKVALEYCEQIQSGQWLGDVEIQLAMMVLQKAILIVRPNGKIDNLEALDIYPNGHACLVNAGDSHYDALEMPLESPRDEVVALLQLNRETRAVSESALILYHGATSARGLNWYAISGCLMVLLFKEHYLQAIPGQEVQFDRMKQAFLNFYFTPPDVFTTGISVRLTPVKALKALFELDSQHALTAMDALFFLKFSSIYTYDSRRANELKKEIALLMHAHQPSSNALADLAYLDAYIQFVPDQTIVGTTYKESKFRSALRYGSLEQIKRILDSSQVYPALAPTIQMSHLKTLYPLSGEVSSNQYWINDLAFAVFVRPEAVPLMFDFLSRQPKQDCQDLLYSRSGIGSRILLFMIEKNEPALAQLFLAFVKEKLDISPEEICDAFILDQDEEGANALYYATCGNNKKEVLKLLIAALLSVNVERINPATWSSLYQAQIRWVQGQGWPNGPCVRVFVDALIMYAEICNNSDSLTMALQVLSWAPDGLAHPEGYLHYVKATLFTTRPMDPAFSAVLSEILDKLSEDQKMILYMDYDIPDFRKLLRSKITSEEGCALISSFPEPEPELKEEDWFVVESKDDVDDSHRISSGGLTIFRHDDPKVEGEGDTSSYERNWYR